MPKQDGNHNSKGLLRSATFGFGSFNKHYHAHFYVRHKIFLVNLFCTPHLQRREATASAPNYVTGCRIEG